MNLTITGREIWLFVVAYVVLTGVAGFVEGFVRRAGFHVGRWWATRRLVRHVMHDYHDGRQHKRGLG